MINFLVVSYLLFMGVANAERFPGEDAEKLSTIQVFASSETIQDLVVVVYDDSADIVLGYLEFQKLIAEEIINVSLEKDDLIPVDITVFAPFWRNEKAFISHEFSVASWSGKSTSYLGSFHRGVSKNDDKYAELVSSENSKLLSQMVVDISNFVDFFENNDKIEDVLIRVQLWNGV